MRYLDPSIVDEDNDVLGTQFVLPQAVGHEDSAGLQLADSLLPLLIHEAVAELGANFLTEPSNHKTVGSEEDAPNSACPGITIEARIGEEEEHFVGVAVNQAWRRLPLAQDSSLEGSRRVDIAH